MKNKTSLRIFCLSFMLTSLILLNGCQFFSNGSIPFREVLEKSKAALTFPLTEDIELMRIKNDDLGQEKRNTWNFQYTFPTATAQSAKESTLYFEMSEGEEKAILLEEGQAEINYLSKTDKGTYQPIEAFEPQKWSTLDLYQFLSPLSEYLQEEEVQSHIEKKTYIYSTVTHPQPEVKKRLNQILPEAFDELYLPYFDYALKVEFQQADFSLQSLQIKVIEKTTNKVFYQLDWQKSLAGLRKTAVRTFSAEHVKIEEQVSETQMDEEEQKKLKKAAFLEKIEKAYQVFLTMNAYDTTSKTEYRLKADQQTLEAEIETNGSEFYENGQFLHYIGRERIHKAENTKVNLLAIREDQSYEHALQSENKNTENKESSDKESETQSSESSEQKAWNKIEPKLSAKYYEQLYKLIREHIDLFEIEENKEEQKVFLRYEGEEKIFFPLSKEVLAIDLDYFKVADVQGTVEIIFDDNFQVFSSVSLEVKSTNNDVLYSKGTRYFQKFRTGDHLDWPVQE